ncbi:MAG: hypothetical protein Q9227_006836 [Pyrenula ochraceoflavens]
MDVTRHLLVEPDSDTYQSYLSSLTNAPGSRFRHVQIGTDNFENLEQIFLEHYLPEQEGQETIDYEGKKINRTLLVTGNLSPNAVDLADENRYVNNALYMNHSFNRTYFRRSLFNRYGLVRMLLWIPHATASRIVPTGGQYRSKDSTLVEIANHVNLIAAPQAFVDGDPKPRDLHLQSRQKVASLMAANQTYNPKDRVTHPKDINVFSLDLEDEDFATKVQNIKGVPDWVQELRTLKTVVPPSEVFRSNKQAQNKPKGVKTARAKELTAEIKRYRKLRRDYNRSAMFLKRVQRLTGQCLGLENRHLPKHEAVHGSQKLSAPSSQPTHERNLQLEAEAEVEGLPIESQQEVHLAIDNFQIYYQSLPSLLWDQRQAEPLVASSEEFFPQLPLCLLDYQPNIDQLSCITSDEKFVYVSRFLSLIFKSPKTPFYKALEQFAPGSLDYFIQELSALSHYDEESLNEVLRRRVRAVPTRVFLDVALAWSDWPFGPPFSEVLSQSSMGLRASAT